MTRVRLIDDSTRRAFLADWLRAVDPTIYVWDVRTALGGKWARVELDRGSLPGTCAYVPREDLDLAMRGAMSAERILRAVLPEAGESCRASSGFAAVSPDASLAREAGSWSGAETELAAAH